MTQRRYLRLSLVSVLVAAILATTERDAKAEAPCAEPVGPEAALLAGITAIYAAHTAANYLSSTFGKQESVIYQGLPDFLARNPECCSFTPYGEDEFAPTPEWSDRHSFYGFARATFQAYWIEDDAGERQTHDTTRVVAVTICGETIWYDVDDDNW